MSSEPLLSLDDVTVEFSSGSTLGLFSDPETVRAVDDVSLDIGENDVVALIGESGCGKSTLGKTAIGAQRPTSGTVRFRGQDVWDAKAKRGEVTIPFDEIRRSLQIIHQDPGSALNPNQRILTSLMLPLKRWHSDLSHEEREYRILTLLEHVGMTPPEDFVNRYPHQLSGGEKQRITLVRSLLLNPDLILADEAVSALDVSLRVEMMELMLELQDTFDTSFLFISHNLSNARYNAETAGGRIGVMYLGEFVEIGTPERFLNNPQHPYTHALRWATPELDPDAANAGDPPMRKIDVPDAANPPPGCRYHTRCPEARKVCQSHTPELIDADVDDGDQRTACFRVYDEHEYWQSEPLTDEDIDSAGESMDEGGADD
jgi:peptide/nickel transport system ATP-binding protein